MSASRYDIKKIHGIEIAAGKYYAASYEDAYETLFYEFVRKMIADFLLNERAGGVLLDVGCGTGNLTKYFLGKSGWEVTGIDISEEMVKLAEKRLSGFQFFIRAAEETFLNDASFDAVMGFSVLHHIPDLRIFFDEVRRVLKPGGFFVFAEPVYSSLSENKMFFRLIKFPFYPFYLFFKKKNHKELTAFKCIDFDAFVSPAHRQLSKNDMFVIGDYAEKPIYFRKFGVLFPWFGMVLFKGKWPDKFAVRVIWLVDIILSNIFRQYAQEVLIKGIIRK